MNTPTAMRASIVWLLAVALAGACAPPVPGVEVVTVPATDTAIVKVLVLPRESYATIAIHPEAFTTFSSGPSRGQRVTIDLGEFGEYTARVRRATNVGGTSVWSGAIDGDERGRLTLAQEDSALFDGLFTLNDTLVLQIEPVSAGVHIVRRIDRNALPMELPPFSTGPLEANMASPAPADVMCGPQTIDVLVVVIDSESKNVGGIARVHAEAAHAIYEANTALEWSEVPHRFRMLPTIQEVRGLPGNTRDFETLLAAMEADHLAGIHALRIANKADIVVLWMPDGTDCGLTNLLDDAPSGHPDKAFVVVAKTCAVANQSMAHELGHVLGAAHDRYTISNEPRRSRPARPYAYGFQDPNGEFRDLMAGKCTGADCLRQLYFANPTPFLDGRLIGSADSDIARTLRQTGCIVSGYQ